MLLLHGISRRPGACSAALGQAACSCLRTRASRSLDLLARRGSSFSLEVQHTLLRDAEPRTTILWQAKGQGRALHPTLADEPNPLWKVVHKKSCLQQTYANMIPRPLISSRSSHYLSSFQLDAGLAVFTPWLAVPKATRISRCMLFYMQFLPALLPWSW